jgi:hypothetical protein
MRFLQTRILAAPDSLRPATKLSGEAAASGKMNGDTTMLTHATTHGAQGSFEFRLRGKAALTMLLWTLVLVSAGVNALIIFAANQAWQ